MSFKNEEVELIFTNLFKQFIQNVNNNLRLTSGISAKSDNIILNALTSFHLIYSDYNLSFLRSCVFREDRIKNAKKKFIHASALIIGRTKKMVEHLAENETYDFQRGLIENKCFLCYQHDVNMEDGEKLCHECMIDAMGRDYE